MDKEVLKHFQKLEKQKEHVQKQKEQLEAKIGMKIGYSKTSKNVGGKKYSYYVFYAHTCVYPKGKLKQIVIYLGKTLENIEEKIARYFERYPEIKKYFENNKKQS